MTTTTADPMPHLAAIAQPDVSAAFRLLGEQDRSDVALYALGWLEGAEAEGRPADWRRGGPVPTHSGLAGSTSSRPGCADSG